MSVSTTASQATRRGRPHRLIILATVVAAVAVVAWAIATYAVGSGTRPAAGGTPTEQSVLSKLTPHQRQYVLGITALTPAQMRAAFGTGK